MLKLGHKPEALPLKNYVILPLKSWETTPSHTVSNGSIRNHKVHALFYHIMLILTLEIVVSDIYTFLNSKNTRKTTYNTIFSIIDYSDLKLALTTHDVSFNLDTALVERILWSVPRNSIEVISYPTEYNLIPSTQINHHLIALSLTINMHACISF